MPTPPSSLPQTPPVTPKLLTTSALVERSWLWACQEPETSKLPFSSPLSRASVSLVPTSGMSPCESPHNFLSDSREATHRNRQDAIEAIDIAARGKVKVFFKSRPLAALKEYVLAPLHRRRITEISVSVYEGLEAGTVAGRVVLDMQGT